MLSYFGASYFGKKDASQSNNTERNELLLHWCVSDLFDACTCIPPIECLLVACLVCVVDTPTEGEGEYVDDIAGEEPGQPEPAGKPPLTLASPF